MVKTNRVLVTAAVAASLGLGFLATGSFANGPMILGPSPANVSVPKVFVTPTATVSLQAQALSAYRQLRTFWLSRAIVR